MPAVDPVQHDVHHIVVLGQAFLEVVSELALIFDDQGAHPRTPPARGGGPPAPGFAPWKEQSVPRQTPVLGMRGAMPQLECLRTIYLLVGRSHMNNAFLDALKQRRTQYSLGRNLSASKEELLSLIQDAIKHSPSSFNSQSSRALVLDRKSTRLNSSHNCET